MLVVLNYKLLINEESYFILFSHSWYQKLICISMWILTILANVFPIESFQFDAYHKNLITVLLKLSASVEMFIYVAWLVIVTLEVAKGFFFSLKMTFFHLLHLMVCHTLSSKPLTDYCIPISLFIIFLYLQFLSFPTHTCTLPLVRNCLKNLNFWSIVTDCQTLKGVEMDSNQIVCRRFAWTT